MPVQPRSAQDDSSVENEEDSCAKRETSYADSPVNLRMFSGIGIVGVFRGFCGRAGSIVVISQHEAGDRGPSS